jgi:DNA (cytosine-5)-methyltransferase 1
VIQFQAGEIFSGAGGLGLATKKANVSVNGNRYCINPTWAIDYDESACNTYRHNICPDKPDSVLCKNVQEVNFADLAPIDALLFGFPCNDFSIIGEKKGIQGEFGALYTYGIKALKQFQPKWFLAENVSGLASANAGQTFKTILNDLVAAHYNLTVHLYKFERYGIPQARHRIIIVGIRKDLSLTFQVPQAPNYFVSAQSAIENPPILATLTNHEFTKQSKIVVERLKHIKPGENAWTTNMPEYLRLKVKGAKLSQIYKRLSADKPAYTVTGSGGGGTHIYHWVENRALTNRERARLQTFPDDFVFKGSKESVRKQIGMAVPVTGAIIILEAILKTFAGIGYPYEKPSIGYLSEVNDTLSFKDETVMQTAFNF